MKFIETTYREDKFENLTFPVLLESRETGLVVLFVNEHQGLIVKRSKFGLIDEGSLRENLTSPYNNSTWKKYNGSITMENAE